MARMIPADRSNFTSSAEKMLFGLLKDLPADHVVLHSLGLMGHEHKRWSEIDFTVINPDGIFVLEVKGGTVERVAGEWFVTTMDNRRESLGSGPFAQVGGAEAAMRRFLRDRVPEVATSTMGYAVVTPDCRLDVDGIGEDSRVCFDAPKISRGLAGLLKELAIYWRSRMPGQSGGLDEELRNRVVEALCADVPAIPSIRGRVDVALNEIHVATREQERLLTDLIFEPRVFVNGPAGSGKSTLAVNECKRRVAGGQTVLYLCHSGDFARFLSDAIGDPEGLIVTDLEGFSKGYEALGTHDVLVIDEAQDVLPSVNLESLNLVVRNGLSGGTWRVLYDGYQLLSPAVDRSNILTARSFASCLCDLRLNVRSTVDIAYMSSAIGYVDRFEGGISGPKVETVYCSSDEMSSVALAVVDRWIKNGLASREIVVVPTTGGAESSWTALDAAVEGELTRRGVVVSSAEGMKGREATGVVYVGLSELDSLKARQEAYLACTRAMVLLSIVLPNAMEDRIGLAYSDLAVRMLTSTPNDRASESSASS